jgi:hypothetical protein
MMLSTSATTRKANLLESMALGGVAASFAVILSGVLRKLFVKSSTDVGLRMVVIVGWDSWLRNVSGVRVAVGACVAVKI